MAEEITVDEFIAQIQEECESIDNSLIYLPMKKYGCKRVFESTVNTVKACILVEKKGLWITVELIQAIIERTSTSTLSVLHNLGDKRVIQLQGDSKGRLCWVLHPDFKKWIRHLGIS